MAFRSHCVLGTLTLAALQALAQDTPQTVTVTGRGTTTATVAGFGNVPLGKLPMSAISLGNGQLEDAAVSTLADITRLDASLSDAYNSPGYWSSLTIRGFVLDNRYNYRRDGLPINAETAIGLANKQSIEVLKGTSGLQAGTSAPGGLVNFVVKRPTAGLRAAAIGWAQDGSVGASVDLSERSGASGAFGWRINAAAEKLDPQLRDAEGRRHLLALAADARLSPGSQLEGELEWSRQRQPSMPGFSLLGGRLPDAQAIDPRINLNNQPWSLPVVLEGRTASLRWTHELRPDWRISAHAMAQRLKSDDRVAFPFGCSAENNYDRYCSDGSFDLYDFRSEGERRDTDALDLALSGRAMLGGMDHRFTIGLLASRFEARFNRQAYNWVGVGQIDGSVITPADPTLTDENTNRDERSTELRLQDQITLGQDTTLWAGLRSSRIARASVRTDGSRGTDYHQQLTTPWLALSHQLSPAAMVYASWGQGVESEVVPNRSFYANAGQPLAALKSRQIEAGIKRRSTAVDAGITLFDIRRPMWADFCDTDGQCVRLADGAQRHRGLEADAEARLGAWNLRGSVMWLKARREGSIDANVENKRPANVPAFALKAQAAYNVPALPGLALLGFVTHEGDRAVLPDNSIIAGGWTRIDLGLRYAMKLDGHALTWRAGVDNVADRRAWKETPYQFSHVYLYPLAPRRAHASLNVQF
ncbi:TonB-dependent siderophore receptor [Aquincola sp. S2]|uniref:TonB-dependent siderophore receptor n=1 Tax=Pseudaquabacterium terrae TaxID=2732868 RepID=A0ABX2EK46_9BURK|nr:TonB-dependent siderophore receptor [Aquabacterium terrae]NRF68984.1 TonB-dependent siderophore receptor [Aquabacterium terrae]